ncbi:MAG: aspartate carbamoyltransferase [Methanosarcinales archaeon]|nr:aspartate carbamoyltransferase [Methanosarcinales archaeon]
MTFDRRHILSMKDFTIDEIDFILESAVKLETLARGGKSDLLAGNILALLFYEPSTRTRMSFETAMLRLGGSVLNLGSKEASSVVKGETLADTIRVISTYSDAIVLRHPSEGSARMAAEFASVPIINGGDGAGHHPTQTLLDLYTIKKESHLDNLDIAIVGDLKYGRTVHSLAYALSLYGANITFVSPPQLKMPDQIKGDLKAMGARVSETENLDEVLGNVDVLYMTRIQKERFPDPTEYNKVVGAYKITGEHLENVREDMIFMHPLPRVYEIDSSVDGSTHARYFEQSFYGVPIRMALLTIVLGVEV